MKRQQKTEIVEELKETLGRVASLVLADFRGLTVLEANAMRSEIRSAHCKYRVVKNTLVKRAIAGTPMEGLGKLLKGPIAIAYSFEDPVGPAKILEKFSANLKNLELKGGFLDGQVLDPAGIKRLANMKGKDELRADFLRILIAPAQGFVRLLAAAPQNFLYLLRARERGLNGE
ncbi:MAG: 50S ribosomal protein L10 [Pseudomonadota bacterium]